MSTWYEVTADEIDVDHSNDGLGAVCKQDNRPVAGEKWRYRKTPGRGFVIVWPSETRTVLDRTLGGGVVYAAGRFTRHSLHITCSKQKWDTWQATAVQLPNELSETEPTTKRDA